MDFATLIGLVGALLLISSAVILGVSPDASDAVVRAAARWELRQHAALFLRAEAERGDAYRPEAFELGFVLYLPFLVLDLVVASVLLSMGMMMLPPVIISLPFKIIFFVLVDGWYLVAGSLVQSYGNPGPIGGG